jgi:hypothetical protein
MLKFVTQSALIHTKKNQLSTDITAPDAYRNISIAMPSTKPLSLKEQILSYYCKTGRITTGNKETIVQE